MLQQPDFPDTSGLPTSLANAIEVSRERNPTDDSMSRAIASVHTDPTIRAKAADMADRCARLVAGGWVQGQLYDHANGGKRIKYCALGAVRQAFREAQSQEVDPYHTTYREDTREYMRRDYDFKVARYVMVTTLLVREVGVDASKFMYIHPTSAYIDRLLQTLLSWNDDKARTAKQVTLAFRNTATYLKGEAHA